MSIIKTPSKNQVPAPNRDQVTEKIDLKHVKIHPPVAENEKQKKGTRRSIPFPFRDSVRQQLLFFTRRPMNRRKTTERSRTNAGQDSRRRRSAALASTAQTVLFCLCRSLSVYFFVNFVPVHVSVFFQKG